MDNLDQACLALLEYIPPRQNRFQMEVIVLTKSGGGGPWNIIRQAAAEVRSRMEARNRLKGELRQAKRSLFWARFKVWAPESVALEELHVLMVEQQLDAIKRELEFYIQHAERAIDWLGSVSDEKREKLEHEAHISWIRKKLAICSMAGVPPSENLMETIVALHDDDRDRLMAEFFGNPDTCKRVVQEYFPAPRIEE
jgi:hypothetical protein